MQTWTGNRRTVTLDWSSRFALKCILGNLAVRRPHKLAADASSIKLTRARTHQVFRLYLVRWFFGLDQNLDRDWLVRMHRKLSAENWKCIFGQRFLAETKRLKQRKQQPQTILAENGPKFLFQFCCGCCLRHHNSPFRPRCFSYRFSTENWKYSFGPFLAKIAATVPCIITTSCFCDKFLGKKCIFVFSDTNLSAHPYWSAYQRGRLLLIEQAAGSRSTRVNGAEQNKQN